MNLENKNNKTTAIIFVILIVLIIGSVILYDKLGSRYKNSITLNKDTSSISNENDKENYSEAPDFEVEDSKGNMVTLSDMKGKAIVVNFWASWCGPCKSEMPDFEKMYKKYGEDIEFMMVNMTDGGQETKENAKNFIKAEEYKFPVYYDVNMSAARAYNVMSIPATYFINKDGKIVAYANGAINESAIKDGIEEIK